MIKASGNYTEIFKLKKMLEDAGITFEWVEHFNFLEDIVERYPDITEHYQICYPVFDEKYRIMSVIEGFGTYGAQDDKLEIMGGLYPAEQVDRSSVVGWLTAENVFDRIKKHWDANHKIKEE